MNRGDYLPITILIILLGFLFGEVLLSNQIFAQRDVAVFVFPLKHFVVEQLNAGRIPLWNPYTGCGVPFQAEIQSHMFYPISLIFYLFPLRFAFNLFIIIHFFLAGLFMYAMMREFRYNREPALFSALTFMLSGYLTSLVDLLNNLASLTWMPLVFFFSKKFVTDEKARSKNALRLSASMGIQFLGGEPLYVLMTLIPSLIWILYETVFKSLGLKRTQSFLFSGQILSRLKALPLSTSSRQALNLLRGWKHLKPVLILGSGFLGLIAFQLLPFIEYAPYSTRAHGFSYQVATQWSLPPWQLLQFILPRFFEFYYGHFWGYIQTWVPDIYLGVVPVFLICCGLRPSLRRKGVVTFFATSLTIFVLLSLGKYLPIYPFLYQHLGFKVIRYPVRFLAPAVFFYPFLPERGFEISSPGIPAGQASRGSLRLYPGVFS